MNTKCETCAILWRDYSAATHAHIRAEAKLELAKLKHDQHAIQCLIPQAQTAAEQRRRLRQQIGEHERHAHTVAGAGEANGYETAYEG